MWNKQKFCHYFGLIYYFKNRLYDDPNKKGSVIIKDLNDIRVMDKREVYKLLKKGSEKRRTAETKMNAHSSR